MQVLKEEGTGIVLEPEEEEEMGSELENEGAREGSLPLVLR